MPLRAASSLTASLRAPPLAEGTKAGMRGCSCRHSSLLTGRRAMRAASITLCGGASDQVVLAALSIVKFEFIFSNIFYISYN